MLAKTTRPLDVAVEIEVLKINQKNSFRSTCLISPFFIFKFTIDR